MKLITLTSTVLMLATSVVAVTQPPSGNVVVAAPGARSPSPLQKPAPLHIANSGGLPDTEGPTVANAQRPRHCQSCSRYIDKCIKVHDPPPKRSSGVR